MKNDFYTEDRDGNSAEGGRAAIWTLLGRFAGENWLTARESIALAADGDGTERRLLETDVGFRFCWPDH
jgi:hypothetical protein